MSIFNRSRPPFKDPMKSKELDFRPQFMKKKDEAKIPAGSIFNQAVGQTSSFIRRGWGKRKKVEELVKGIRIRGKREKVNLWSDTKSKLARSDKERPREGILNEVIPKKLSDYKEQMLKKEFGEQFKIKDNNFKGMDSRQKDAWYDETYLDYTILKDSRDPEIKKLCEKAERTFKDKGYIKKR